MNDSIISINQYRDFKFVAEKPDGFGAPQLREVTYISAGWNFMILFAVMILMVVKRYFTSQNVFGTGKLPFQRGNVDKNLRETASSSMLVYASVIISSILLLSLFLQKTLVIYGANKILYDNFGFYTDVMCAVSAFFIFNYLLMTFYSWMFNNRNLLLYHVNLHISNLELVNMALVPILMILFFYPYKFLCILCVVLMLLVYVVRFINFFVEIRLLSKVSFVNIFLYLCTLEIIPIMVMFKMIYNVFIVL